LLFFHFVAVLFQFVGLGGFVLFVFEVDFHVQEAEFGLAKFVDFLSNTIASIILPNCINRIIPINLLLILNPRKVFLSFPLEDSLLTWVQCLLRNFNSDSSSFVHLYDTDSCFKILDNWN
jgi:hypothetical protein